MLEFNKYKGLLFVGDPHLWSRAPGERLDGKMFTQTVLNKLQECVNIALKEKLYLIILGDLFHKKEESDIDMLTKLIRILRQLPEPAATVEGNHEKSQLKLSDDVALSMLREAGVIYTMEKNGLWGKFNFTDGTQCYVGATPYGEKIPTEASIPAKEPNPNIPLIWLTHHDLDFGETYPGAVPIKEIKGVSMLVNGHIHKTKKSMTFGKMRAHNPGNITRLSVDVRDHIPSVWKWTSEQNFELEPIVINHQKEVFNMVGRQIEAPVLPVQVTEEVTPQQASQFVAKMHEQMQTYDPAKTDDGVYVKDSIRTLGKVMQVDDEFMKEMLEIAEETIQANLK